MDLHPIRLLGRLFKNLFYVFDIDLFLVLATAAILIVDRKVCEASNHRVELIQVEFKIYGDCFRFQLFSLSCFHIFSDS